MSSKDELMGQATRCVRRFAPEGRQKIRRFENGYITACKISDANPNELIASWSGDHIYSFDIARTPDVSELRDQRNSSVTKARGKGKTRSSGDRKRKRTKTSSSQQEHSRKSSRRRHDDGTDRDVADMALRVRYENGQTEDIAMRDIAPPIINSELEGAREVSLTESQKRSSRIAKSLVWIRKMIFSLDASRNHINNSLEPSSHHASFTAALGSAASILPEMDEISRSWKYPVNPLQEHVVLQSTLRANRDSSRRFVQAAGVLSRLLGGRLQTAGGQSGLLLDHFQTVSPASHEGPPQSAWEIFRYDFLRAIILWLEGGRAGLVQGFKRPPTQRRDNPRYPVRDDANEDAIDEIIIPYLLQHARHTDASISNVDTSRFERDETRQLFSSESSAVIAFASAVRMPLEDLSRAILPPPHTASSNELPPVQDRKTATKYWAFKVGRGLLMNAAEGVNFQFVDTAFGGLGQGTIEEDRVHENIDSESEEDRIREITVHQDFRSSQRHSSVPHSRKNSTERSDDICNEQGASPDIVPESAGIDTEHAPMDDVDFMERHVEGYEEGEENAEVESEDEDDVDVDDEDDDEDDAGVDENPFIFQSASERGRLKASVESDVRCDTHTRQYRGHCNVKTVKDVNFYGLHDDYVVSGSDGGHLFIWDRRTSELLNILEGDGEVVNVIQGKLISGS